jgi:PAT family beta-lactamase induction signal transducer AmpG
MKRNLPVWLLGLANMPLGITGATALLIAPQVLAARHVPETTIANITTFGLVSTMVFFLVAPVLDVRFTRRTYAIAMSFAASVLTVVAVLNFANVALLGLWLFLSMLTANLNSAAIGGWFGSVLPHEDDAALGAWMTVANVAGFGIASIIGITLVHDAGLWVAALVLGAMNLLPLLIIFSVQPPIEERRRASESFGKFGKELMALARRRDIRRLLLLLVLPCASFALTNTLGGLGGDYHASEKLIALIGLYLGIGIVGGLTTLLLLVLPLTPAIFALAFVLQNIWQSAGLSTGNALALSSIGKNNPLASTQFAVLTAAMSAPITYMQLVDGHAYGAGGLTALYAVDGGLDLVACSLMVILFAFWSRRSKALLVSGPATAAS